MGTGGHYITMLHADWLIFTSHDPLPSSCHSKKMLWNPSIHWWCPKSSSLEGSQLILYTDNILWCPITCQEDYLHMPCSAPDWHMIGLYEYHRRLSTSNIFVFSYSRPLVMVLEWKQNLNARKRAVHEQLLQLVELTTLSGRRLLGNVVGTMNKILLHFALY